LGWNYQFPQFVCMGWRNSSRHFSIKTTNTGQAFLGTDCDRFFRFVAKVDRVFLSQLRSQYSAGVTGRFPFGTMNATRLIFGSSVTGDVRRVY
jgi:hypothetical protein